MKAKPNPKAEFRAKSKSEPKVEPNSESKVEPNSESKAKSKSEPKVKPNSESKVKPNSEPRVKPNSEPIVKPKMKVFRLLPFLAAVSLAVAPLVPSRADDGGISFGGSPHLLKGHDTVAMKSELVKMEIQDKLIKVDCRFVFHNSGPACTVRMGFPDEGQGAAEPYQGEDKIPTGKNLKAAFISYDSWVDGKKVPTTLVPTADRTLYWHAKTVTFKADSDCVIRDVYTLPPGGQMTSENGFYHQTSYVLHTGSSWKGPIGLAEIIIKFAPDTVPTPLQVKSLESIPKQDIAALKWSAEPKNTVVYSGVAKPLVEGNTLHFLRSNFKPSKEDDIHLFYNFRLTQNGQ